MSNWPTVEKLTRIAKDYHSRLWYRRHWLATLLTFTVLFIPIFGLGCSPEALPKAPAFEQMKLQNLTEESVQSAAHTESGLGEIRKNRALAAKLTQQSLIEAEIARSSHSKIPTK